MATTTTKTGRGGALDFIVKRDDLRQCRLAPATDPAQIRLAEGEALLAIDRFAFTSNNVSYAAAGDMLKYWDFFPAPQGWGRIPVWGFADVVRTQGVALEPGERVFGYFPMSTHLVMRPDALTPRGFVDGSTHRAALPLVYNQYTRVAGDPSHDPRNEDRQALLWPLFATSFLLDDFIADNDGFAASTVVLSSASSKTAFGLAFLLARRRERAVVGLTSASNLDFVKGLGCYERVVRYDEIASLPQDTPVVFVDMAGDAKVTRTLHEHFRDNLKYSCSVGATHWEQGGRSAQLPGAPPKFFFAPTQIQKRNADWGPGGLQTRMATAWRELLAGTEAWIQVVHGRGGAAVERVYKETLEGRTRPDQGHVLSLREGSGADR